MIRLLDLVLFGPVRPSSLCHGFYYYLAIQFPPTLGKQARPVSSLESWAPRCPGPVGGQMSLYSAQKYSTTTPPRSCYTLAGPKGNVHADEQIVVQSPRAGDLCELR